MIRNLAFSFVNMETRRSNTFIVTLTAPSMGHQESPPPAPGQRCLHIELPQGVDFAQDIGVDPAIVVDVEVSDSRIGGEVIVDELATEACLRNERQPPAAALIVVDRSRHMGGDCLLAKRIERHQ